MRQALDLQDAWTTVALPVKAWLSCVTLSVPISLLETVSNSSLVRSVRDNSELVLTVPCACRYVKLHYCSQHIVWNVLVLLPALILPCIGCQNTYRLLCWLTCIYYLLSFGFIHWVKKTGFFSFEHNVCKYCPIFIACLHTDARYWYSKSVCLSVCP